MKNKSAIFGLIIIALVCVLTTGCLFYNLVDSEEFKNHFGAVGYTVSNTETPKYDTAKTYLVAEKSDVPFKIEYYEFSSDVEAQKVYKKYKEDIPNYITTDSKNTESTSNVLSKIVAVSTDEYIVISRVKNTLIFIAGTNDYATEIDKLLTDIKY